MGAQNAVRINIMFSVLFICSAVGLGILLDILATDTYVFHYICLLCSFHISFLGKSFIGI